MKNVLEIKGHYYKIVDGWAKNVARNLAQGRPVTDLLMGYITELYASAKSERGFQDDGFETAYHTPISSDLEFMIARILYHYSMAKRLGWKIYLRRQVGKTAPDVRIERKGKTIAVIEVKAKAGWIQPFFNSDRAKKDMLKMKNGLKVNDPRDLIKKVRSQLEKYVKTFGIKRDQIFVFLPTLKLVHRSKSERILKDYIFDFVKNSRLKKENLILLSKDLELDLSETIKKDFSSTNSFEKFIMKVSRIK